MAYYLPSASKVLINGTGYQIAKGRTKIGGTGYSINSGRTKIGGTGYRIRHTPLWWTHANQKGTYWTDGSYTANFTENTSKLRAELTGSPTQSGNDPYYIGFYFRARPGDQIQVTVTANAGNNGTSPTYVSYKDANNQDVDVIQTTSAVSSQVASFTCGTGNFDVVACQGNKDLSVRWIEITRIAINGTQVFPA